MPVSSHVPDFHSSHLKKILLSAIDPQRQCLARVIELEAMPFVNQVYARIAFGVLRFNQEDTHSISAAVVPNMASVLPVSGVRVSSVN